jgi:hypothetical protein
MIVVYDTRTYQIVGHASRVFDNGKWREPTIDEIYPGHLDQKLDALYLPDEPRLLAYGADQYRVRRDANGAVTGIELAPRIIVSCDAKDQDNDGIPDLPADGSATTTITAALDGGSGVEVSFRTTRGALSHRSVKAGADGKATVTLRAAAETVTVDVTATAADYRPGSLRLELLPPP